MLGRKLPVYPLVTLIASLFHALVSWRNVSLSGILLSRHCPLRALNSISAILSQLPCLGVCDLALLFGFIDETREIGPTTIQEVMQDLNVYTPEQLRRRHTCPQRDTDMVRTRSVRRPRRLALMAALVVVSLLGAGALWQSSLVSHKLKEYIPRSEASSVVVVPPSPAYREPPRLPHSPAVREPPSRR